MTHIIQRFNDWRLERRINRLARQGATAYLSGDRVLARCKFALMAELIGRRSQARVARMERKQGVRLG